MPEAIGENVPIIFKCLCCQRPVHIWAFMPVHPPWSNVELVPEEWRKNYRQFWYVNADNDQFNAGQLWQLDRAEKVPSLYAVALSPDDNPFINRLDYIPLEGLNGDRVFWTCPTCTQLSGINRQPMWSRIMELLEIKPLDA